MFASKNISRAERATSKSCNTTKQPSRTAEALINGNPASPEGYVDRATARLARRNEPAAEVDLKKAIEVAPQNPLGYSKLGALRLSQKRFVEAEILFEQALERDANFSEALQGLVGVYSQEKQPVKAVARVNAQIAKAPSNSTYYLLLGMLLASNKDLEKNRGGAGESSPTEQKQRRSVSFTWPGAVAPWLGRQSDRNL
jgi:tetratricopeptide (TPR) repeat protein